MRSQGKEGSHVEYDGAACSCYLPCYYHGDRFRCLQEATEALITELRELGPGVEFDSLPAVYRALGR